MSLSHSADSVVFYLAKLKTWLKPACTATGTSLNSEISRLARLARANNEGADQTAPMCGCLRFVIRIQQHRVFSHVGSFFFTEI